MLNFEPKKLVSCPNGSTSVNLDSAQRSIVAPAFVNTGLAGLSFVHILALLPFLDILIGQIQALSAAQIGSISLAQGYHAFVLSVCFLVFLSRLKHFPRHYQYILVAGIFLAGSVALSTMIFWLEGKLSFETLIANSQILYWLVLWLTILAICKSKKDCKLILGGIAVAAIYASLTIIYLYITQGHKSSIYENLVGNAAGFKTAKGLTGIIATGGLAGIWLFRSRQRIKGAIIFFVCLAGILLTYQRAGLVGIGLGSLWLGLWALASFVKNQKQAWAFYPIILLVLAAVVIFSVVGTEDLASRWDDLSNPEKAGSGRLQFWQVAFESFCKMDTIDKLGGVGYTGIAEALVSRYGARIHTHSDILDVLIMFGMLGIASFIFLHAVIIRFIYKTKYHPSAFAVATAIYLVMFFQGVTTGQILCLSVMSCYLAGITCLCLYPKLKSSNQQ